MERNKAQMHRSCALKLDMMKAYNIVEWAYLKAIMIKLGFSQHWTSIVMNTLSFLYFLVIFNEKKLNELKSTRSIRQGDPLSPYLFLLAAEGLSCLLKTYDSSHLSAIKVAKSAPLVKHLLFADENLLFFKSN